MAIVSLQTNTNVLYESERTLLTFTFNVNEVPPPQGIRVYVVGNVPQSLNQLDLFNISVNGADFPEGDFDFSGFYLNIRSQTATLSFPMFDDGDPEEPLTVTYTLTDDANYDVAPNQNQVSVTFRDSRPPVNEPVPPPVDPSPIPIVSVTANPTTLVEDEGTATVITFTVSNPIPPEGIVISLDSDVPFSLGNFDIFSPQTTFTGGQIVGGNQDNSGFDFRITSQTASITLPIYNDPDLAPGTPGATENDSIGVRQITYFLRDGDAYDLNANANQIAFTLADTRSQVTGVNPLSPDSLLQQPVYRFYNPISRGHFFTINPEERDTVLANPEWEYQFESAGFNAASSPADNLLPVFRFYNPISKGHFFTTNAAERDTILANPQWEYSFEGVGFYAYGADANLGSDIYRFYNPVSRGHFFTSNPSERDTILANPQWEYSFEGVGFEAG